MFILQNLYKDYNKKSPEDLIKLINSTLSDLWGSGCAKTQSMLRRCIEVTRDYTNNHQKSKTAQYNENGDYLRKSKEPYINHTLRVALILIHERLFDTDVLQAAIMHDLFEDTDFTYELACDLFSKNVADLISCVTNISESTQNKGDDYLTAEEIDYAGIINKCNSNKIAFYIKFADRLDNLMTIDAMPIDKQEKKIEDTKKYMYPLLECLHAYRFLSFIKDAVYKIEQRLTNKEGSDYVKIQSRIEALRAFSSTINTYNNIKEAFCSPNALYGNQRPFKDVRLFYPTIQEISIQLKEKNIDFLKFKQSNLTYNMYFIANDDVTIDYLKVLTTFLSTQCLSEYAIEKIDPDGFNFIDDIRNRYHVILTTSDDFNLSQYGSTEVELTMHTPESIDDDFYFEQIQVNTPDNELIHLPKGSSVIDFAFKIHKEVGDKMIAARVNGKNVPIQTKLKNNDTVEIIVSDYSESLTQVNWLMSCATKNAKRAICKIIQSRLEDFEK